MNDLKSLVRPLVRAPGFSAVVVLSLALGIGANATVLCWLRQMVFRSLPGTADQGRIVALVSNFGGGGVSLPDLRDFDRLDAAFVGVEASMVARACLTVDRAPEWLNAQIVSANFFPLLGVKPMLGRTFAADEDQKPGGDFIVVISERLWRRRFGADPGVIGRVVDLNRKPFTVIGVVPANFRGSMGGMTSDIWAPLSMIWEVRNQEHYFLDRRGARGWHNLARLRDGVSREQAQAVVTAFDARLARTYPDSNREAHHRVVAHSECPWGAQAVMGPALRLLLAVSVGVQLIVMANVANLMLARAVSRRKEIAVRLAAGASRRRLVRQFLTESAVLALPGGALGVLGAAWAVDVIPWFLPPEIAPHADLNYDLDASTLGLTLVLTLVTAIGFGLVPALKGSRLNVNETLKESGRGTAGGAAHHRWRSSLVVAEVAIALVLLVGAVLCGKGLQRARTIDFGFQPGGVLLAHLSIGMNGYTHETGPVFYREARRRLAEQPGVEEAALASWFPLGLSGCKGMNVHVEGYERKPGENPTYEYAIMSPRYFATLQLPLLSGRDFTDRDDAEAVQVAIVNEAFAQRFWPGLDPLGRRFQSGRVWRTVVGVAKTGKYNRLDEPATPFFYLPYQQGVPDLDLSFCLRTRGNPAALAPMLRSTLRAIDPGVELQSVITLEAHSSLVLVPQRIASVLLILLGGVALSLSAMGVFAVMAYAVTQRTTEFGIRIALGATTADVLGQVMRQGLGLVALGLVAGLLLAVPVTRLLTTFLYGVSPFDPVAFGGVALALAAVAAVACYRPARRATRVDPMTALRAD